MRKLLRVAILAGLIAAILSQKVLVADKLPLDDDQSHIGVRLYNLAHAPAGVLEAAQRKAAEVLRKAGVESDWYVCPRSPGELAATAACAAATGPTNLVLKLVPNTMAAQFYASEHSLGFALLSDRGRPTSDAWVFYERVVRQAHEGQSFVPAVLGYAMAHEIGHLLLGEGSHTRSGIMKGFWGRKELRRAERGELEFSGKQVDRMHRQIGERVEMSLVSKRDN